MVGEEGFSLRPRPSKMMSLKVSVPLTTMEAFYDLRAIFADSKPAFGSLVTTMLTSFLRLMYSRVVEAM